MQENNPTDKINLIDIDGVLKTRNPKLYKMLPGFLIRYFKRTIHQDDINEIIIKYKNTSGLEFVKGILNDFGVKLQVSGLEKLDKNQRYVFAGNHPLGGLDGLALILAVGQHFGNAKAVINDLLLYIENLRPVFVGVNTFGKNTKEHIKQMDELFQSEIQTIVFPAGLVSRKVKGIIQDMEWKKSFIAKAIQHQRHIVPVYIDGKNSNFFYNLANFRKKIGIKMNLELIYLPDEMFNYRNKNTVLTLKFGEPILYTSINSGKSHDIIAKEIREIVYSMR